MSSTEPTPDFLEQWRHDLYDAVRPGCATKWEAEQKVDSLAAVLPLYRERLLTDLADAHAIEFGADFECGQWLRSKVGESSV